jgi:hypothetical protein
LEALYRIVCARGLIGDRAEKARTAIGRYVRVLERAAARFGSDAAGVDRRLVDGELIALEDKLQQWKLLGSETALVCDAALAVVTRERVENLCDRRIAEVLPQPDAPRGTQSTGLLAK